MRSAFPAMLRLLLICILLAGGPALSHGTDDHAGAGTKVGRVAFPNSGKRVAQADFLRGLALLHNFEYEDAAEAFRRAQRKDPKFAMAYWGEAMSYNQPIWFNQDADAARAALARLAPAPEGRLARARTEREKDYLRAVEILYGEGEKEARDHRYALAMERLHERYPRDVDAACFHALALLGTAHAGRDIALYMRAAALAQDAFASHPLHPGAAHYLIHSVDDPVHAPLGLAAARAYARIAPDASHAQHMTSHIFLALGMWDEVARANERAWQVAVKRRQQTGSEAPARCNHFLTWLSYAYIQQGRLAAARELIFACADEVRAQAAGAQDGKPGAAAAATLSAMRTRYLVDTGEWEGSIAALSLPLDGLPEAQFSRDLADAYRRVSYGPESDFASALEQVKRSTKALLAALEEAGIPARHPARRAPAIGVAELEAVATLRRGDADAAIAALRAAAGEQGDLPLEFGPPDVEIPVHELLGEILLEQGRGKEAVEAWQAALAAAPGRTPALEGLARGAQASGDVDLAENARRKLTRTLERADTRLR
jgi:tetratricopeptide (TPR) repeat protein